MKCVQCAGRAQLPLCTRCTTQLDNMLADLDWLLRELETTAARKDRLVTGMSRQFAHPCPANIGACDLLRDVTLELRTVATALDQTLPDVPPRLVVWWLRRRLDALAGLSDAKRHYHTVAHWAGFSGPGPIHDAINRPDRRLAGPCPDCEAMCYARHEDVYTACQAILDYDRHGNPIRCGTPIDVEKNRARTIIDHDLLPEKLLLTILDNLNEHVSRVKLYSWITSGKLPAAGCLDGKRGPKVYSLSRARALRRREQTSEMVLART